MRYKIAISCEKQVRVFNVESELTLQQVFNLVTAFVKKGYQVTVTNNFKKRKKLISLEELINAVSELRFYKHEKVEHIVCKEAVEQSFKISFPVEIKLGRYWVSDWGGTFFELSVFDSFSTVQLNFYAIKREFELHGLDLCKSKDEDLWYTHSHVCLHDNGKYFWIDKIIIKKEYISLLEKVEL